MSYFPRTLAVASLVLVSQLVLIAPLAAQNGATDWPQFLGPNRNGISAETGLIESFPASGPKAVWRVAGGAGMSGIAVSGKHVLTLVQDRRNQNVIALDRATGKTRWQTAVAPAYMNAQGNGPRGTPTVDGNTAYVYTGQGVLAALDLITGKIQWKTDAVWQFEGKVAEYGMACSPLVVGNAVVVTVGSKQAGLAAFDKTSGKPIWQAGSEGAGYSSPVLMKVAGKQQIVSFTDRSALGIDPAGGKVLWRFPYVTNFGCNTASPVAVGDAILLSAGEDHGSVLLRLVRDGQRFQPKVVWESQGKRSVLRAEWQTPVALDGYLYAMDNVGGAGPITHLTCIEAATGKRMWQKGRFGKGNLIAADGKLFITTMRGELVIVRATPKKYEELGRATVIGSTRQTAALAGGRLFLRDSDEIVCVDVKAGS